MKRLILLFAIVLGWSLAVWASAPAAMTSLHDIRALTNDEARHAVPVAFEATVTFFRSSHPRMVYVQDGDAAIYILSTRDTALLPGDRVMVRGTTRPSFRPIVESNDVTVLHHGSLPKPIPAEYNDLVRLRYLCKLVTVRAVVRSADPSFTGNVRGTTLHLLTDEGAIDASVVSGGGIDFEDLLDDEVEVTGVAGTLFDSKMQQAGVTLHVNSIADLKVIKRGGGSPWTLPVTPMDAIFSGYRFHDLTARVRVRGTITYYQPGTAVVLEDGAKSLWISTQTIIPLQIGDVADATGFPDFHDGFLNLVRGEIKDTQVRAPITPQPATWQNLSVSDNIHLGHIYDLVSIEGKVVAEARQSAQDEYVLNSNGRLFTAIYHHIDKTSLIPLPPMKQIPIGAKVRVSGICVQLSSNPFNGELPFNILMRSFDDIEIVAEPSWLNIGNLVRIVGVLLLVVFVSFVWGVALDRRVRRQTAALSARIEAEAALERRMTQIEQQRSQILEDINGTRPLTEILDKIMDVVSFRLDGAPCWCEFADGPRFGKPSPEAESQRLIQMDIPARSGPPLGTLFAALDLAAQPSAEEAKALTMGTRLASVAIETRRLYSDLVHRSEFDLLTDIQNRFSLDKHLDALIESAGQSASIFGLIYIDLDEFKKVNDEYGHQVGDLYLQEVAERMKRQLRPGDMLARLGGDEFAVLVPIIRCRADVEEIALRLERSFDNSFAVESYVLSGSASVGIAIFPADGTSKDSLLDAADAAMYMAKNNKRQNAAGYSHPVATPDDRT